jgi:hypothetical protein
MVDETVLLGLFHIAKILPPSRRTFGRRHPYLLYTGRPIEFLGRIVGRRVTPTADLGPRPADLATDKAGSTAFADDSA